MTRDRLGPEAKRLLVARLDGIAKPHAQWRQPTQEETDAAVAEVRKVVGDRPDLLAETAGVLIGASEGRSRAGLTSTRPARTRA